MYAFLALEIEGKSVEEVREWSLLHKGIRDAGHCRYVDSGHWLESWDFQTVHEGIITMNVFRNGSNGLVQFSGANLSAADASYDIRYKS